MSINSNFKGVSRLAMILAAGLLAACGDIQIQGPKPTLADTEVPLEDGDVGTLNASAAFPEGAESLVLSIQDVNAADDDCHHFPPPPPLEPGVVDAGMGLRTLAKPEWTDCVPFHYKGDSVDAIANEGQKQSVYVIHIQRGEEVKPIRLRAGTYTVMAEFFDASNQLLYTGSELFSIINGDSTKVTIRLKKIELGEVTIGFEIEKPEVLPTKISDDAHVELHRSIVFGKHVEVDTNIDLDLTAGMAVVSYGCSDERNGYACKVRTIGLTKIDLLRLRAILQTVSLKSGKENGAIMCADPLELISVTLKRCEECQAGGVHKFFNSGCGQPYHTLSSDQFSNIEGILSNLPGKLVVQATR